MLAKWEESTPGVLAYVKLECKMKDGRMAWIKIHDCDLGQHHIQETAVHTKNLLHSMQYKGEKKHFGWQNFSGLMMKYHMVLDNHHIWMSAHESWYQGLPNHQDWLDQLSFYYDDVTA